MDSPLRHLLDAPFPIQNELLQVPILWMVKEGGNWCFPLFHLILSTLFSPISAHHPVSISCSAPTPPTQQLSHTPLGETIHLITKGREKIPICYNLELEASSSHQHTGCISDFLVFREHLGRFHSPLLLFSP